MSFEIDRQTLNDLSIFKNGSGRKSIFDFFYNVKTIGGRQLLEKIFGTPLSDRAEIQKRIDMIEYVQKNPIPIVFDKNRYDFVEFYLKSNWKRRRLAAVAEFAEKVFYKFNKNNDYYIKQNGIKSTLLVLKELDSYASELKEALPESLNGFRKIISDAFNDGGVASVKALIGKSNLTAAEMSKADDVFLHYSNEKIKELLKIAYHLDVYQCVSAAGKELGFTLPEIADDNASLEIDGLVHPLIPSPIKNDIRFDRQKNIVIVTGSNMAGKSSLLKAMGIAVYLSQLGFPVPASHMKTPTFTGLITSIDVTDDVEKGLSFFYKEVLRVKHVAESLNKSKNIFVIFDELFRGTNVKDAYDASFNVVAALAEIKDSFFIISTHIVEVAHQLESFKNIHFLYMETVFEGGIPANTYRLKSGITDERLGMWIIEKENIIDIIGKARRSH